MAIRKKTKVIRNWEDLINYIEKINPHQNTIILSGWINKLDGFTGETEIDTLIFNLTPVKVLQDVNNGKYDKKQKK